MVNKAEVRHYFVEGLTSRGYISLLPLMCEHWQRIYFLLGGPGMGKSTMIKMIGLELLDRGYEVDFLRSAWETDSVAGLLLSHYGVVMLDAHEVMPYRLKAPVLVEKFVDFTPYCDEQRLMEQKLQMMAAIGRQKNIQEELLSLLWEEFGTLPGKRNYRAVHKDVRANFILGKLNLMLNNAGPWPLAQNALQKLQQSKVFPLFLHGLSPDGWLNLAPHFLAEYDQIRLSGDEKTDALHWVLDEAQQMGQIMEIILHPLNPDEIIGIIFPERKLAIWQGDPEIIQEQGMQLELNGKIKKTLTAWHAELSFLKSIYSNTVDFDRVDALRIELLNQILRETEG